MACQLKELNGFNWALMTNSWRGNINTEIYEKCSYFEYLYEVQITEILLQAQRKMIASAGAGHLACAYFRI